MADVDYKAILKQAFDEYGRLLAERENLDLEIAKQFQFIRATTNMLADEERDEYERAIAKLALENVGLTEAIRRILQAAPSRWHTAVDVRDKLVSSGFDFASYKANPLASVHSVLKRLKPTEAENTTIDGVMAWRWKETRPHRLFRRRIRTNAPSLGMSPSPFDGPSARLSELLGTGKPTEKK